ncbi:hypothetical protein [Streptomyces cuspidosporus]|uniref:Integral membrane protein n=1 Tax=Streptomyces cuspidosporus TaxID=66882 RepID=A0ABP5SSJ4_9ACTN
MNATLIAVTLALLSAVAYATAAVAQERLAARTGPGGLRRLPAQGAWWSTVGLNSGGALLHVAALRFGPLTLVQPLGALTLVAAVPLGARAAGRRATPEEWLGTALTLVGLGALLPLTAGGAPDATLGTVAALAVAAGVLALVALLTHGRRGRGLGHAAASGITSGAASALTQTLTVAGLALTWRFAVVGGLVAGLAVGGLLLSQTAYTEGLGAPLAVLTLANPLAAAAIGLSLLGERVHGGPAGVALAGLGAAVAGRGVVLLTRAPHGTPTVLPDPEPPLAARPRAAAQPRPIPFAGPAPLADAAPLAGPAPLADAAPLAGPAPLVGTAPLAGPVPLAGPAPLVAVAPVPPAEPVLVTAPGR